MKFIWWIVGAFVFIILLVILLTSGGKSDTSKTATKSQINLSSAENKNSQLQFLTEGPVVADENHNAIRISVTPSVRTVEVLHGYNLSAVKHQDYANNQDAYDAFLAALKSAGFTNQNSNKADTNIYSLCSTGNRFVYEATSGGKSIYRTFSTSCRDKSATFSGNASLVQSLFRAQIPDYNKVVSGVSLGSSSSSSLF